MYVYIQAQVVVISYIALNLSTLIKLVYKDTW